MIFPKRRGMTVLAAFISALSLSLSFLPPAAAQGTTDEEIRLTYYETIGKDHAFGRSCDDRVEKGNNHCPLVLSPSEDEANICTYDDSFCLVIPQEWCFERGGKIDEITKRCGGLFFKSMAEMLDVLRNRGDVNLPPDNKEMSISSLLAENGREIVLLPMQISKDFNWKLCEIGEGKHLGLMKAMGFNPQVYRVTLEQIRRDFPDEVAAAEGLCIATNHCLAYALHSGSEEMIKEASYDLQSKLCTSMENSQLYLATWRLTRFVFYMDEARESGSPDAASFAWRSAYWLSNLYPEAPMISKGFLDYRIAIAHELLYALGVSGKDRDDLLKQTRP